MSSDILFKLLEDFSLRALGFFFALNVSPSKPSSLMSGRELETLSFSVVTAIYLVSFASPKAGWFCYYKICEGSLFLLSSEFDFRGKFINVCCYILGLVVKIYGSYSSRFNSLNFLMFFIFLLGLILAWICWDNCLVWYEKFIFSYTFRDSIWYWVCWFLELRLLEWIKGSTTGLTAATTAEATFRFFKVCIALCTSGYWFSYGSNSKVSSKSR